MVGLGHEELEPPYSVVRVIEDHNCVDPPALETVRKDKREFPNTKLAITYAKDLARKFYIRNLNRSQSLDDRT